MAPLAALGWRSYRGCRDLSIRTPNLGVGTVIGLFARFDRTRGVILSRYTLGRSFSVTAKATALVTWGIYSRVRNPIYVSGFIFIAGRSS